MLSRTPAVVSIAREIWLNLFIIRNFWRLLLYFIILFNFILINPCWSCIFGWHTYTYLSSIKIVAAFEQEHMELEKRYRELTDLLVLGLIHRSLICLTWWQNNLFLTFKWWCIISVLQANTAGSHGQWKSCSRVSVGEGIKTSPGSTGL